MPFLLPSITCLFGLLKELPAGLATFYKERGKKLGVSKRDIEVMKNINFRGRQPNRPEDFELLYLFLRKWVG